MMNDAEIRAWGAIEEAFGIKAGDYMSEAARDNEGKPELGYILDYPRAVEALCAVMEYGAKKYARDNWKKGGKPDAEYLDAALRHIYKHKNEGPFDPESGCLHLAHALWNYMTLIELNLKGPVCKQPS